MRSFSEKSQLEVESFISSDMDSEHPLRLWTGLLDLGEEAIPDVGLQYAIPRILKGEFLDLCQKATTILQGQESLVEIPCSTYIIGDLHGNLHDLLRILRKTGLPPGCNLLFLGDYVDRGNYSTEVIILLFSLLVEFPDHVVLLRGNHEFTKINSQYGFKAELDSLYDEDSSEVHAAINDVFSWLPFSAIVQGRLFCVHGGISPKIEGIEHLKSLRRPIHHYKGVISDLVWSDPALPGFHAGENVRGEGYMFCSTTAAKFLDENGLKMIVRSHQCVNGYQMLHHNRTCTVFSSSRYTDENAGAILFVGDDGTLKGFPLPVVSPWPARHLAKFHTARRVLVQEHVRTFKLSQSPLKTVSRRRRQSLRLPLNNPLTERASTEFRLRTARSGELPLLNPRGIGRSQSVLIK